MRTDFRGRIPRSRSQSLLWRGTGSSNPSPSSGESYKTRSSRPISTARRFCRRCRRLGDVGTTMRRMSIDAKCCSLIDRNGGPAVGELVDPVGDQIVLHLCQTEVRTAGWVAGSIVDRLVAVPIVGRLAGNRDPFRSAESNQMLDFAKTVGCAAAAAPTRRRFATALAMQDLGEVTKLGFGVEGVKMCRSEGV